MKKYIVTVKNMSDKEAVKSELLSHNSGHTHTLNRSCDCVLNRPISKNNTYILSDEEASELAKDERIHSVTLDISEIPLLDKHISVMTEQRNRPETSEKKQNYNNDILTTQVLTGWWSGDAFANITNLPQGENVDVVIIDTHIQSDHPEFALNADGSGGSRVNLIDWYEYSLEVEGYTRQDSYNYNVNANDGHGTHVAGTVAGNTNGWAKKANIYFIDFLHPYCLDYVRAFHNNKEVNPITGVKNPTIVNNSWAYSWDLRGVPIDNLVSVNFRGATFNRPNNGWNWRTLESFGIRTSFFNGQNTLWLVPNTNTPTDIDIQEMINDGIVVVSAAGNNYSKTDLPGGIDYNNSFNLIGSYGVPALFYNRGTSPANASISVGAMGVGQTSMYGEPPVANTEYKVSFSNCGPGVDIYAPGDEIMSSLSTQDPDSCVDDYRNFAFKMAKWGGTSMASPQVCGALASYAGTDPSIDQQSALNFLVNNCKNNRLFDLPLANENMADVHSLQRGNNRQLFYPGVTVTYT